jgi:hypothetical protein
MSWRKPIALLAATLSVAVTAVVTHEGRERITARWHLASLFPR